MFNEKTWKDVFGAVDLDEAFGCFQFTVGYYFNTIPFEKVKNLLPLVKYLLHQSQFPDTLKLLVSKHIFKGKGSGITLSTTISILSTFSKEVKKLFLWRLTSFFSVKQQSVLTSVRFQRGVLYGGCYVQTSGRCH